MTTTESQVPMLERMLVAYGRHFPVQKGKPRLINNLWSRVADRASPHRLARLNFGGCVVDADISQYLQRQYYFTGTYFVERDLIGSWCARAAGARVFLDVGANSGIYSLAALSVAPEAVADAFEPTPVMATILRRNAERNFPNRLFVHEMAVSDNEASPTYRPAAAAPTITRA